nr:C-type lectin domain-containing type 1 protein 2 [Arenicola marina]
MMQHSKKIIGMAMSALVLGLLLGFLPMSFAGVAGDLDSPCPPGFAQSRQMSKCYRFVFMQRKWEEAREHCRSEGGVLLELANRAEIHALVALANQPTVPIELGHPPVKFWTGGRRQSNTDFIWDGSRRNLPQNSPLWRKGEPNHHREHYAELHLSDEAYVSGLNDAKQHDLFFICESPLLA